MEPVYFDNAATTPLDKDVVNAMQNAMVNFGNPSSIHSVGRKGKASIERERRKIAKLLNCSPGEIVFTSGGTEADNLAILGAVEANTISTIISSPLEHPAVLKSIEQAQKLFSVQALWVNVLDDGSVDMKDLANLIAKNPKSLVSLMHVNNEIGNILDVERVGKMCREFDAILHTDAVQSIGHISIDLKSLSVDLLSGSAHKIHGPKGIGFLFVRKGVKLSPQIHGGSQERGARGGTENTIGIVGLGKAVEVVDNDFELINSHLLSLKSHFIAEIRSRIPSVAFNGLSNDLTRSSNAIVSINFPKLSNNELILFQLDLNDVLISGGSACSSGSLQGSHVLNALGVEGASIRISFSKLNTIGEVDHVVDQLVAIIIK